MEIEILFEDEYIMVVNKPNNILIHKSYYARNVNGDTLLDLLFKQKGEKYFPVHRLDRKTSGVLILAKHKEDVSIFQELFSKNEIKKTYLGIVRGFVAETTTIDSPVKNPDTKVYKDAETLSEPLNRTETKIAVHPYNSSRYSLVKLTPATGRMHQLRIHMNKISHPIVGDYKYGDRFHNRMFEQNFDCHNLFLHAYSINLIHPISSEMISVQANLPSDWNTIFKSFNWSL